MPTLRAPTPGVDDPYLYPDGHPGAGVLKNIPGLHDADLLARFERDASHVRLTSLLVGDVAFSHDLAGLKRVHHHIFQDVYEWAGRTRDETVTLDGERVSYPPGSRMIKPPTPEMLDRDPDVTPTLFSEAWLIDNVLDSALQKHGRALEQAHRGAGVTKDQWAEQTAKQIGEINYGSPLPRGEWTDHAGSRLTFGEALWSGVSFGRIGPSFMDAGISRCDGRETLAGFGRASCEKHASCPCARHRPGSVGQSTHKRGQYAPRQTHT